jgi:DNA invertase Pin-like site-specific DNA recombinase
MSEAIGYLRVSTRELGRSGLWLAAQRHEIEAIGARAVWGDGRATARNKDAGPRQRRCVTPRRDRRLTACAPHAM